MADEIVPLTIENNPISPDLQARFEEIYGNFPIISSIPTDTPKNAQSQLRLYVNGSVYRLYFYDTASNAWRFDEFIPSMSGNSGKFLTNNGSNLSWSNLTGFMNIATDFQSANRLSANSSNGTPAITGSGAQLTTSATAPGFAQYDWELFPHTNGNVFGAGGIFTANLTITTLGTTGDIFIGLGQPTVSGGGTAIATSSSNQIGFRIEITSSVATLFGITANGSIVTQKTLTTLAANDVADLVVQINSTSLVTFYWRKNGGAQGSDTSTSAIPTANQNIARFVAINRNTATNTVVVSSGMSFQR